MFTHCKKCWTSVKDSAALCTPAKWYFLWQLTPERSCVSSLICLTVWKEIWEVEDKSSTWALEGDVKAQVWSGDPDVPIPMALAESTPASAFFLQKNSRTSWGSGQLAVTSVASVIPGSNVRWVWNGKVMAPVLLKVIRHLVRTEGILCCEGKRAKRMYKFLKEEKKKNTVVNLVP